LLIFLLALNVNVSPIQTNGTESQTESLLLPHDEPLENSSLPYLELSDNTVDLGLDLIIWYGMENESEVPRFKTGYQYSIILLNGFYPNVTNYNVSEVQVTYLDNGTTLDIPGRYLLQTIEGSKVILPSGMYTVFLNINSTNRGLLNTTETFEVVAKPGANIKVDFLTETLQIIEGGVVDLGINESQIITLQLTNIGSSTALNISVGQVGLINEPIGFTIVNASIPAIISVLPVLDSVNFTFSLRPAFFGIGRIAFSITYSDGLGNNRVIGETLETNVFPEINAWISIPLDRLDYILEGSTPGKILVKTEYGDSITTPSSLFMSVQLISDKINFAPISLSFIEASESEYEFSLTPHQNGSSDIILYINFHDVFGGNDEKAIEFDKQEVTINEDLEIVQDPGIDYLPIIAVVLWISLLVFVLILYFRKGLRRTFFSRILGINFFSELQFSHQSVIIDGSNVAWEDIGIDGKPKLENITLAAEELKRHGFKEIVIVADAALRYQIERKEDLDQLTREGIIKVLPAKVDGDSFILRLSAQNGSLILTNDLFKEFREEFSWIDKRRVPYSILQGELYLHPIFEKEDQD
jgi:hypothetical protein